VSKIKLVLWLLVLGLLLVFAVENWHYPNPPLRLLRLEIPPLPQSLIIYTCLVIGFLAGWFSHVLRIKRELREAEAEAEKLASAESPAE